MKIDPNNFEGFNRMLTGVAVTGGPEPYHAAYLGNFGDTTAITKAVAMPGE